MKIDELKALGVGDVLVSFCRGTSSTLTLNFGLAGQTVPAALSTFDALEMPDGETVWQAADSYKRVLSLNYAANRYAGTLTLTDRVERLNQCVYASINKHTGLPDFAVSTDAIQAAKQGFPASSVLVKTAATVSAVMEYAGVSMTYTAPVGVHIVSAGVQSCMSHLNAAHVKLGWAHGEAGSVVLKLNKNAAGYVTGGTIEKDGNKVGDFEGIATVTLANRAGVGCPGAGLRGKYNITVGNLREPGAFCSYISPTVGGADAGTPTYASANARANKVEVLGLKVPTGWKVDSPEMRKKTNTPPGELLKFWGSFPAFKTLAKVGGCVTFGGMWLQPLAAEEAFPAEGEEGGVVAPDGETEASENDPPANYLQATENDINWSNAYVLYKGSFPASPHRRENVSGLKFCKASISQVVVLSSKPEGVSAEELDAFFDGVLTFDGKQCRYTELSLPEVYLINRRRKLYKEGTNSLFADDPDYADSGTEEEPETGEDDTITSADYKNFLSQQIREGDNTYDGTVELVGVEVNPLVFCGGTLSIEGLADIWQGMKTPIARVDYSFFTKRLTLTTGSDEAAALTVDELAEIARMQRQRDIAGQANNQPWTQEAVGSDPEEGEEETEEETPPMIAPQIAPAHGATKGGKPREPKTLYADGDKWLISAGSIATPQGYITFPETDVTALIEAGYMVKAGKKYDRSTGQWEPYVYRKKRKEASETPQV